jgi:hypothetical protein
MKLIKMILLGLALAFSTNAVFSQKIQITVNYADAKIYALAGNTILNPAIGTGSVEIKLDKNDANRIVIIKEGFEPLVQEYSKSQKWPKEIRVNLENRMVEITAEPFDADIYVNGTNVGREKYNLILPKGKSQTIEVKKAGFATNKKVYYNQDGQEDPPFKDHLVLESRLVEVSVTPADADIFVNEKLVSKSSEDVIIHPNECVTVRVEKEGYTSEEQVFCNSKKDQEPPVSYSFSLNDRVVKVNTTPETAEIKMNGKIVGSGSYEVKVPNNECAEVIVFKDGFISRKLNYCNSKEYQAPPVTDHIELVEDEAYKTSVSTDMANVNVTIEVNKSISEGEAWKLLSSIVMSEFDVLEVTDKETGYIRTAWQVQSFNNESTIRTRVIVKLGDSDPLKYVLKIASERADKVVSVKDDQDFEEWNRILKRYQYIMEEAQARLK